VGDGKNSVMPTEKELIQRITEGDKEAEKILTEREYPKILRRVRTHPAFRSSTNKENTGILNLEDADDITNTVWMYLIPKLRKGRLREGVRLSTYSYQFISNNIYDFRRKAVLNKYRYDQIKEDPPDPDPIGMVKKFINDPCNQVMALILFFKDEIPEKHYQILCFYYYEGFRFNEINDCFKYTKGYVSQIHRKTILRIIPELIRKSEMPFDEIIEDGLQALRKLNS